MNVIANDVIVSTKKTVLNPIRKAGSWLKILQVTGDPKMAIVATECKHWNNMFDLFEAPKRVVQAAEATADIFSANSPSDAAWKIGGASWKTLKLTAPISSALSLAHDYKLIVKNSIGFTIFDGVSGSVRLISEIESGVRCFSAIANSRILDPTLSPKQRTRQVEKLTLNLLKLTKHAASALIALLGILALFLVLTFALAILVAGTVAVLASIAAHYFEKLSKPVAKIEPKYV